MSTFCICMYEVGDDVKLTKAKAVPVNRYYSKIEATIDGHKVLLSEDFQKEGLLLQGYVFVGQNQQPRLPAVRNQEMRNRKAVDSRSFL